MNLIDHIKTLSDTQLIFGPAFILLGFISLFIASRRVKISKDSKNWPFIDGYIMHSMYSLTKINNEGDRRHSADIRYYYIINGRKYEGTKVAFTEANPQKYVNQFKEGDKAKVYYDPNNHKRSVLINGCHNGSCSMSLALFSVIIPFFMIGIGVFVFG